MPTFKLWLGRVLIRLARMALSDLSQFKMAHDLITNQKRQQSLTAPLSLKDINDASNIIEMVLKTHIHGEYRLLHSGVPMHKMPMRDLNSAIPILGLFGVTIPQAVNATAFHSSEDDALNSEHQATVLLLETCIKPWSANTHCQRFYSQYAFLCTQLPAEYIKYFQMKFIEIAMQFDSRLTEDTVAAVLTRYPAIWLMPFIHSVWHQLLLQP